MSLLFVVYDPRHFVLRDLATELGAQRLVWWYERSTRGASVHLNLWSHRSLPWLRGVSEWVLKVVEGRLVSTLSL